MNKDLTFFLIIAGAIVVGELVATAIVWKYEEMQMLKLQAQENNGGH